MAGEMADAKEGEIILYITPKDSYVAANNRLLDFYVGKHGFSCIYVTMNRSYAVMSSIMKESGIDPERIFFIDAVTPIHTSSIFRSGNAVFVGSPRNLTNVSIVVGSTIKTGKGKRILFLDSLSSMLLYNGAETGTRFMHFLLSLMRTWKVSSAIMSIEKETDAAVLAQLVRMCDRVVETG